MKRSLIPFVACCAFGMLVACHAHRDAPAPLATLAAPATTIAMRAPRAGLFTAGQPAPSDWRAIAARGVTTVINLRPDAELAGRDEATEVEAAGLAYHQIPVDGAGGLSLDKARALGALLQEAKGPVLVHCASGNRVGALIALGAADAGTPAEEAIALGRAAGMTSTEARVRELLGAPAQP